MRCPAVLRSGMPSRSVKDCRVGRKKCALLAMTNLIGFAGKRNGFQNETFDKNDAGRLRTKNGRIKEKRPFPKQKRFKFVSLRGRRAAVAIFKPKAWHPVAKHRSGKRLNPELLIRPAATPQRRFSGSAISRRRKHAFLVRSIFHTIKDRISPRSHTRLKDEFHRTAFPCLVPKCRLVPSKIAASSVKNAPSSQ